MLERLFHSEPLLPPGYWLALFDARYLCRDYQGAAAALKKITNPSYYARVMHAVSLAQLNHKDEARRLLAENPQRGFDRPAFARQYIKCFALAEDKKNWLEGFRKAGIEV